MVKGKLKIPTTTKEMRKLIIWAKYEIDEYERFIKLCENEIKKLRKKRNHNRENVRG